MSFDPTQLKGYAPTMEEILDDVGAKLVSEFGPIIFQRCNKLYEDALQNDNIEGYGTSYEFINCDSSKFYRTLVNMGYGSPALVIDNDLGPEVYFLMFTDKAPEKFRPIIASHESTEYSKFKQGVKQHLAHLEAQALEPQTAERLGIKKEYSEFLQQNYFGKFEEMKKLGLF
jgi:hypothetical protein